MGKEKWVIGGALAGAAVGGIGLWLLNRNSVDGSNVVADLDMQRYAGLWYEIARLPNMLEKNLDRLTEEYVIKDNGTLEVITRAYNVKKDKWIEMNGELRLRNAQPSGALEVSYFKPVWFDYNVLAISEDYRVALVSGGQKSFLWLMSKDKDISKETERSFIRKAVEFGFPADQFEYPRV